MKKLCFVLSMIILFSCLFSCSSSTPPVYTSTKSYNVGMWVGVPQYKYDKEGNNLGELTDEEFLTQYEYMKEAGFTFATPGYPMRSDNLSYYKRCLSTAHKVGMKQICYSDTLNSICLNAYSELEGLTGDEKTSKEQEIISNIKTEVEKFIYIEQGGQKVLADYADALYGFHIADEPSSMIYDILAEGQRLFNEAYPDLIYYINLYPNYAGQSGLGTTYNNYVNEYIEKFDSSFISYDFYPLHTSNSGEHTMQPTYLRNMDTMKKAVINEGKGREVWSFAQCIEHTVAYGETTVRGVKSVADASFQAYSYFAYGVDCLQWFCWMPVPSGDSGRETYTDLGLVSRSLEKTEVFEYVKTANSYLNALMPYYENFDFKGIMISKVDDATGNLLYVENSILNIKDDKTLQSFTSTEDAFLGVFEDKDGNNGYMVVNYTDPILNKPNEVTLKIKGKSHVLVVLNGTTTTYSVKNKTFSLTLQAGDGAFILPY